MDNYEVSIGRIAKVVPKAMIIKRLKRVLCDADIRISQTIVNFQTKKFGYYFTSVDSFYIFNNGVLQTIPKSHVVTARVVKPSPHGEIIIDLNNDSKIQINNIVYGRTFDYVQDIKPRALTKAGK